MLSDRNLGDLEKQKFISAGETKSAVRMSFGDSASIDAFSRMRVSNPQVVFDSLEPLLSKSLIYSEATSGSASISYVSNQSSHNFTTTNASRDKATRSSKKLIEYVPGTSLMVFCTGIMGVGATGSSQRIGMFDDQNGLFFEQKNGSMGITLRTYTSGSAVDTHYTQSSWNIDTMDGAGSSGITLDFTKTQIFVIDLQWLGVGRVRFGFDVDGVLYYCHEILNANNKSVVYITTPRLPVRFEVENTAASTALTDFRQICASVITEGSIPNDFYPRSINNGITTVGTSTTIEPILSLRLKAAYANKANIRIKNISTTSVSKADHLFQIWLNPTLTGASFADVDGIAQKDATATAISGGTLLGSYYSSALTQSLSDIFRSQFVLGSELSGTVDILTISATTLSGTDNAVASIDYEELY